MLNCFYVQNSKDCFIRKLNKCFLLERGRMSSVYFLYVVVWSLRNTETNDKELKNCCMQEFEIMDELSRKLYVINFEKSI